MELKGRPILEHWALLLFCSSLSVISTSGTIDNLSSLVDGANEVAGASYRDNNITQNDNSDKNNALQTHLANKSSYLNVSTLGNAKGERKDVSLGLENIKENLKWYDPYIRDGGSIFKFAIKHSYNAECASPERFREKVSKCLRGHDLLLSDNTTECKIVVTGDQWVQTYEQLFRNRSLLLRKDAHFLTVKTCHGKLSISDFFVVPVSMESNFKFLPYELDHFKHMLDFELSPSQHGSSIQHVELDVMNSCLPSLDRLRNTTHNSFVPDFNFSCTDNRKKNYIANMFSFYQKNKKRAEEGRNREDLSFIRRTEPKKTYTGFEHCTLSEDQTIHCSAVRHLDRSQKHLYMIALYVQLYFLSEYLDGKPQDLEVCLVEYFDSTNLWRWFYGKLTASSTSKTNRFTLVECCRMTRKLKVYDNPEEDDMQVSWICHDPYRVASLILLSINIFSYIAPLFLPLCIRFFPPLKHSYSNKSHQSVAQEDFNLNRANGNRKHSDIPEICINDEKLPEDENKISFLSPDESKPFPLVRRGSAISERSGQCALAAESRENLAALTLPIAANKQTKNTVTGVTTQNYIPEHDLLFLDRDPVYSFGFKTILSAIFLFHIDLHVLIVARRFLFLYSMWMIVHFGSVIVSFYYPSLAIHFQVFYYDFSQRHIDAKHNFNRLYYLLVFVVPLCYATIHFLLLSPVLVKKEAVSKSLSWNENTDQISEIIGTDPKIIFYRRSKPSEISFYLLLLWRLRLLVNHRFWDYLLKTSPFETPEYLREDPVGSKRSIQLKGKCRIIVLCMFYFFKAPFVLIVALLYSLPFFSVHRELLVNSEKFVAHSKCLQKISKWCIVIMTLISMAFTYFLCLSYIFLVGGMVVFCSVDVVRNIKTNVNHSVLFVSVLLYIQNALVFLEDEYRDMKHVIFHVCKELDANAKSEEEEREKEGRDENGQTYQMISRQPLMWSSPDGEMAIPKRIFVGVCNHLMPYSNAVLHTSLTLALTISFVVFLYVVVIDFQALDQFTGIGQSLMTIFTVSLPGLIFRLRSEAAADLDRERMYGKVKATIKDLLYQEDVFVTTRRASELIVRHDTLCEESYNQNKRRDTCPAWV